MKKLIIAIALAFTSAANAQIVFDPSNFGKNTVTATQQVRQTAIQTNTLARETQQYMLMLQNVKQLTPQVINQAVARGLIPAGQYQSPSQAIGAAEGVYKSYRAASASMDSMLNVYAEFDKVNAEIERISRQSGVSPPRLMQFEADRAAQGKALANSELQRLNDLNGELQYHQKRSDALASAIPSASGALQMLQVVGVQNHLMNDQLTQLIQTTASNAMATQNEAYLKADERKKSAEIAKQAEDRNTKLYQANKK